MKLIVTIPAHNEEENIAEVIQEIPRRIAGIDTVEVLVLDDGSTDKTVSRAQAAGADYIISHKKNKGLARTFSDALEEAVRCGADIVVNTDGDNHYNQAKIPELIGPILENKADVVIGSRKVGELSDMPFFNKYLNMFGSFVTTRLAGLPTLDVSTGFRAYSREAALKIVVYSNHTYTHTTLLSAHDQQLIIAEVPIKARRVTRPSRLIPNIPHFVWHAGINIVRNIVLFRPLRFFGLLGAAVFLVGFFFVLRFLWLFFQGDGAGHVQSLVLAGVLMIIGFQTAVLGLLGSSIGWTRKVIEEVLYRQKRAEMNGQGSLEPSQNPLQGAEAFRRGTQGPTQRKDASPKPSTGTSPSKRQ